VPGVVPAATVITPAAFIVIEPSVGVGAVPGVKLTLVPITAGMPLVVSLTITEGVAPPVEGIGTGVSFTAMMVGEPTTTVAVAVEQVPGAGKVAGIVQMVYG
jgi:hypothetical protein